MECSCSIVEVKDIEAIARLAIHGSWIETGQIALTTSLDLREIPLVKVLHADKSKRIVLPSPAKPMSAWVPVLVTEKEIRLIAYEPPKEPSVAKGKVVMGKDGWPVWEGEMVMDPVSALHQDRIEDEKACISVTSPRWRRI